MPAPALAPPTRSTARPAPPSPIPPRKSSRSADMIVKVKEPQPREWAQLREGQILFTYLHLAPDPEQAKGLMASGCTAIAYETVTDAKGGLPLLAPMSEVAGRLAIEAAGTALQELCRRARPSARRRARRARLPASWCSAAAWSAPMRRGWPRALAPKSRSSIARSRACANSTNCSKAGCARAFRPSKPSNRKCSPPTS